jgi:hypothetical protein
VVVLTFRIVYNAWWMRKGWAMVFFCWIWVGKDSMSDRHFRHELQHCYQMHRRGRLNFYLSYIRHWLKRGYRDNPFEIEARIAEQMPLTPKEINWRDRGRVVL